MNYKIIVPSFVLAAVLCVLPMVSQAQSPEGIEISPAVVEDRVEPGETYRFTLKVTNRSPETRTFYLSVQDIVGLDDRGMPLFSDEESPTEYELSTWVVLPQASVTVAPNETKQIPYSVRVPASASPGAHFGGVFLDVRPPKLRTVGAAVGVSVGTIINLRIAGQATEEAQLREFSTDKLIYNTPEVDFKITASNQGNVLLRPHGLVEVSDMFGRQVDSIRVNENGAPIFPESDRTYITSWEYKRFAFGRYQAIVSLAYGDDERKTLSGTISFWVLPLKPILTALSALFAFVLILYLWMRLYINRKLREMGVSASQRADAYYVKKYNRSASRLMAVLVAVFFFSVLFLFALFLLFA